jgi:hypothetical protein
MSVPIPTPSPYQPFHPTPPRPIALPHYGGFAGRPMPDLPPYTMLHVVWWGGTKYYQGDLLVVPEDEPGDRVEIPWEWVQTWQTVPNPAPRPVTR